MTGLKKKFVEEGFEATLEGRKTTRISRLLADKMVELKYVDSISHVAVGNV